MIDDNSQIADNSLCDGKKCSTTKCDRAEDKLFLGLKAGSNYGWGVCMDYLINEISKLRQVGVLSQMDGTAENEHLPGKLFQALTDINFIPLFENARGTSNFGYTFFENVLTAQSIENSKRFDCIFAGSTWCSERMTESGISNVDVLFQGVDPSRFYPIDTIKEAENFVIFSGGKFEYRKGQDLLLKAAKILMDKYQDMILVTSWFNMWPESMRMMKASPYIDFSWNQELPWQENMHRIYENIGLDLARIITLGLVPNKHLRTLYAETDIGVFPNRCEGGTNLVMMEYMACAKPVIAANTSGHRDIIDEQNAFMLKEMRELNIFNAAKIPLARWEEPSLEELVATIEYAYHNREVAAVKAAKAGVHMKRFTWERTAQDLLAKIDRN